MEGAGNLREVVDESPVEVHKAYEGLDILDLRWLQPVCDSLDLNRVHCYMVLRDNMPKVVHLSTFKLAFLQFEGYLVGMEGLEHLPGDSLMVHESGGVDEY